MGLLDKRAEGIQSELDEAKALREEAQTLLASYERKQREVQDQADRIVAQAKRKAPRIHAVDREGRTSSRQIERRVAAAEDQIASAESRGRRFKFATKPPGSRLQRPRKSRRAG